MKIGILTCHRAHNYGALLQAYALKTYITELGHTVEFVDYNPSYFSSLYDNVKGAKLKSITLKSIVWYIRYLLTCFYPLYLKRNKRRNSFKQFIIKYIINTEKNYKNQQFDIVFYGSDQIWSKEPLDNGTNYYDEIFFGDSIIQSQKKIAYSASMGVVDVEENDYIFLKKVLSNFHLIGVREQELYDVLYKNNLVSKDLLYKTIDPVFLLNKSSWVSLNSKRVIKKPYLLFYDFQPDETTNSIVQAIAKEKGLEIIKLVDGIFTPDVPKNTLVYASPKDFISLFNYADFIFSSSFHGTAFSIVFEKEFYVRQVWNKGRVQNLLKSLDLSHRIIDTESEIDLSQKIDYKKVNDLLNNQITQSKDYINLSFTK